VRERLRQLSLSGLSERLSAVGADAAETKPAREPSAGTGRAGMLAVILIGATLVTLGIGIAIGRRPVAPPVEVVLPAIETIPNDIAEDVDTLLGSDRRKDRDLAATRVLERAHSSGATLPAYITRVAALQAARGCPAKKAALAELAALDDPRTVAVLERLARSPKYGCGDAHEQDCLSCMREDLDNALRQLGVQISVE
jgi:hypothetical protein